MLAGRMKLNHFLILLLLGGVGAVVGLSIWGSGASEAPPVEVTPAPRSEPTPPPTPSPTPAAVAETTTPAAPAVTGSPDEVFVLGQQGRNLGTKKIKDAKRGAWKVNLYQDEGKATVNRAKVDLDRDDNWDHKYTFEGNGDVTRKRSSADDGNYDVQERWSGSSWGAL